MNNFMSKKPIIAFFSLTFFISWTFWSLQIIFDKEVFILKLLGTYGPSLSAILVSFKQGGKYKIKKLLKPFTYLNVNIVWYIFCFCATAILVFTSIGISFALSITNFDFLELDKIYLVIPIFFYVLFFSVLGEELGWRGFVLPLLQKNIGSFLASIIIGAIWGVWHLPLFFIPGNFHQHIPFWIFILQDIALSIVLTWIYNNTKKSLILVHIFHTSSNITLGLLPILPMNTGGNIIPLYIAVILLVIFSICIILSNTMRETK